MILAELTGDVALGLEEFGERHVLPLNAFLRSRETDLEKAGAERRLAGDESGTPGRAALLPVIVGELAALIGQPIDVRRLVAHHALVVGADVPVADVVTPDNKDIRLFRLCHRGG